MRAKVVKKSKGKEEFYGRVGTVRILLDIGGGYVGLEFDDGEKQLFKKDELRMDVKANV